jgi:hypothetical protein
VPRATGDRAIGGAVSDCADIHRKAIDVGRDTAFNLMSRNRFPVYRLE